MNSPLVPTEFWVWNSYDRYESPVEKVAGSFFFLWKNEKIWRQATRKSFVSLSSWSLEVAAAEKENWKRDWIEFGQGFHDFLTSGCLMMITSLPATAKSSKLRKHLHATIANKWESFYNMHFKDLILNCCS